MLNFLTLLIVVEICICDSSIVTNRRSSSRRAITVNYGTEFQPIRLKLFSFQLYEERDEESAKYFEDRAIEAAEHIQRIFKVKHVQDPIVIPEGVSMCGDRITIPSEHHTAGVNDADLILYVASDDGLSAYCIDTGGGSDADWCLRDQFDRQLVGVILICPQRDVPKYDTLWEEYRKLVWIHEILHVLGLDDSHYPRYINRTSGEKYLNPVETFNERGHDVEKLVTPMALQNARDHFDCPDLNGVELEQNKIGHLEFRIFYGSVMTKNCPPTAVISNITLGILYDSGWYDINWGLAKINHFGYHSGCDFAMEHCLNTGDPPTLNSAATNGRTWCVQKTSSKQWGCGYDRRYRSQCKSVETGLTIPTYFRYFSDDSSKGCSKYDDYSDFCNFMYIDYWSDEVEIPGLCAYHNSTYFLEKTKYGEIVGSRKESFCIDSTLLEDGESTSLDMGTPKGFCYNVKCLWVDQNIDASDPFSYKKSRIAEGIEITTVGNRKVVCSDSDTGEQKSVTGYTGYVICPDITEICSQVVEQEIWEIKEFGGGNDDDIEMDGSKGKCVSLFLLGLFSFFLV